MTPGTIGAVERPTSPDPITDAAGYQRHLLSLLGDDDPASVQASTPPALRRLVEEAGPALTVHPEPGEWSALECIGHIVDGELVVAGRMRWIVAHDEPVIIGYDQDLWVAKLRHNEDDPSALLDLFEVLRAANLDLWSRISDDQRTRIGLHNERGPESLDLTFRLAGGHDRVHIAQARRSLEAARR